jgi:hypothetical protein
MFRFPSVRFRNPRRAARAQTHDLGSTSDQRHGPRTQRRQLRMRRPCLSRGS